jgi:hypothetical protein
MTTPRARLFTLRNKSDGLWLEPQKGGTPVPVYSTPEGNYFPDDLCLPAVKKDHGLNVTSTYVDIVYCGDKPPPPIKNPCYASLREDKVVIKKLSEFYDGSTYQSHHAFYCPNGSAGLEYRMMDFQTGNPGCASPETATEWGVEQLAKFVASGATTTSLSYSKNGVTNCALPSFFGNIYHQTTVLAGNSYEIYFCDNGANGSDSQDGIHILGTDFEAVDTELDGFLANVDPSRIEYSTSVDSIWGKSITDPSLSIRYTHTADKTGDLRTLGYHVRTHYHPTYMDRVYRLAAQLYIE